MELGRQLGASIFKQSEYGKRSVQRMNDHIKKDPRIAVIIGKAEKRSVGFAYEQGTEEEREILQPLKDIYEEEHQNWIEATFR
jgi:hypothetical protein